MPLPLNDLLKKKSHDVYSTESGTLHLFLLSRRLFVAQAALSGSILDSSLE
jgi:hypothetical protein